MKKGIHPENYRVVVFKDMSDGTQFFSRSTAATKDTIEIDGVQSVSADQVGDLEHESPVLHR